MQKVGYVGNFESGNQGYGRRQIQTHEAKMVYLIKLTHQKDANHILTRNFFTIAIKTIQLSSHIIKHEEFTEAAFSNEKDFLKEKKNIFAIRGKNPFLFHYALEEKKLNHVKYTQYCHKINFRIKPFP